MRYRIVKNGLGEYAAQYYKWGFWCFIKEYSYFDSSWYIAASRDVEYVQRLIEEHQSNYKRKVWEVVG